MNGPAQIFPQEMYTRYLNRGERLGVDERGNFQILPPESLCHRIKRFFTFQQEANLDPVHRRFESLVRQAEQEEGPDFSNLASEIHEEGRSRYRYLEVNLVNLRATFNRVGKINRFSEFILKVINAIRGFFGFTPIQLNTYCDPAESFPFHWTSGGYVNPFERAGLTLSSQDENQCQFSASPAEIRPSIQELERGLNDYYFLEQEHKNFNRPGRPQISANLEIGFDSEGGHFFAIINNSKARSYFFRRNRNVISENFARYLNALPDDAKTFRFIVIPRTNDGELPHQELTWRASPTETAPYEIDRGSQPFILEPDIEYSFYTEDARLISSFTILAHSDETL